MSAVISQVDWFVVLHHEVESRNARHEIFRELVAVDALHLHVFQRVAAGHLLAVVDKTGVHLPEDGAAEVQLLLAVGHVVDAVGGDDEDCIDALAEIAHSVGVGILRGSVVNEDILGCLTKVAHHVLHAAETGAPPHLEALLCGQPVLPCHRLEIVEGIEYRFLSHITLP